MIRTSSPRRAAFLCPILAIGFTVICLGAARVAFSQCGSPLIPEPNVIWGPKDSVATCPAGDSLAV